MQSEEEFWHAQRQERFLIVGLGELTGVSLAKLLTRMRVPFKVSDCATLEQLSSRLVELELPSLELFTGPQDPTQLRGITQILLSPGVPRCIPLIRAANQRGIPVWSDYDFLYPIYAHKLIAAVTGTDGKTTTTTLLGHLLAPSRSVVVAGNIGVPLASVYDSLSSCDQVVLELSSFMLEDVKRFRADVSTVLNIAEDHVERYPSMKEYIAAKRNIVRHARRNDVFVRNLDDECLAHWDLSHLEVVSLAYRAGADRRATARLSSDAIELLGARAPLHTLRLRGTHLVEDVLVATLMASVLGLPADEALSLAATFPGVPYRFEYVGRFGRVDVFDDSKATSVQAAERALESLCDRQVVLILGGQDKHLEPTALAAHERHLRAVIGYGEAGERLISVFKQVPVRYEPAFADAVKLACACSRDNDVLLLSPVCTSFDQHRDYRERGKVFRELARRYLLPLPGRARTGVDESTPVDESRQVNGAQRSWPGAAGDQ